MTEWGFFDWLGYGSLWIAAIAAIRVFDPDADLDDIKPRLPPRQQAFRGEVSRLVLNALRKSGRPMTVSELALLVLAGRGLVGDDRPFLRILGRRVSACLRHLRKKGLVRLTRGDGMAGTWGIVS